MASRAVAVNTPGDWAYEVLEPRPGTVLLATEPVTFHNVSYKEAAVLLVKVCGCHPAIFGIVLTQPTTQNMTSHMCPVARERYPSFASHPVNNGGPIGPHWTVLHSFRTVGALELGKGLYAGGCLADAQRQVSAGVVSASAVSFYSGYVAWPLHELEKQVAAGRWRVALASSSMLLDSHGRPDPQAKPHMHAKLLRALR